MTITLGTEHEELVKQIMETGRFNSTSEAVASALELLREQSEWLIQNRDTVDAKIQQGLAELDRGEGIPEADLDEYLARLKAPPE